MKTYKDLEDIAKNVMQEYNGFSGELQLLIVTNSFLRRTRGKYHDDDIKLHLKRIEELCGKDS
jgi:hypothetical protein